MYRRQFDPESTADLLGVTQRGFWVNRFEIVIFVFSEIIWKTRFCKLFFIIITI